jgi:hypothetical protein
MRTIHGKCCHFRAVAREPNSHWYQWRCRFGLAMVSWLLCGCATTQSLPSYVLGSSGGRVVRGNSGDVQISAELVTNQQTLKNYFGVSRPSFRVLVVFIKAENTDAADSVLLEPAEMQLLTGSTSHGETGRPLKSNGTILNPSEFAAETIIGGPLSAFMVAQQEKAATDYNFVKWEFRSTTLAPAQAAEGFVYFSARVADLPPDCHLVVAVHDLSNQTTNTIHIPLIQ